MTANPGHSHTHRRIADALTALAAGSGDALVAWGDPDRIRARVRQHLDAGADHVAVQMLTEGFVVEKELPRQEWRTLAPALLSG